MDIERKVKMITVDTSTLDPLFLNELKNNNYSIHKIQEQLIAIVQKENIASHKVLAKAGFKVSFCFKLESLSTTTIYRHTNTN